MTFKQKTISDANKFRVLSFFSSLILVVIFFICFITPSKSNAQTSVQLQKGWNLIGNSTTQPITVANSALNQSQVTSVWKWDSTKSVWSFYSPKYLTTTDLLNFTTTQGYQALTTVNPGEGFWVNSTQSFSLSLGNDSSSSSGYTSSNFSFAGASALNYGWNLISTADNVTPSAFNKALGTNTNSSGFPLNINTLWAWDSTTGKWIFYSSSLQAQSDATLTSYISTSGYEDFTATNTTLKSGVGFGVNNPLASVVNNLPPRLQWGANKGYCGEVSFISAGMYYGQYVSQYDARALASPGVAQNITSSQLLLGINDAAAATKMHLNYSTWDNSGSSNTNNFLLWVKSKVAAGYPVVIGLYNNEYLLYQNSNLSAGDAEYDHIVLVSGVGTYNNISDTTTYYSGDSIQFDDHGLWTDSSGSPPYIFKSTMSAFQGTRQQANSPTAPVYTLSNSTKNYGIAITGILDTNKDTLPVRLTTSQNYETPAMVDGTSTRPASSTITLTITVSNLTPGVSYNLYKYNSMSSVPDSSFNAKASQAAQSWKVSITSGTTYQFIQTINSSDVAVFRAVPATSP